MSPRRSKRVNFDMPIILSGTDSSGQLFQESTRTISVSKHGAKIRTAQTLEVGSTVKIENRSLGIAAKAAVVRAGKKRFAGESVEIGVQLARPENVWGIDLPLSNWEFGTLPAGDGPAGIRKTAEATAGGDGSPAAAQRAAQLSFSSLGQIPAAKIPPATPGKAEPSKAAAPGGPPLAAIPAASPALPQYQIDEIAAAVLAKVTQQLDEAADERLKLYSEKLTRFTNQFAVRMQADFQDAANVLDSMSRTVSATFAKADEELALKAHDRLSKSCAELKEQEQRLLDTFQEQLSQIAVAERDRLQEESRNIRESCAQEISQAADDCGQTIARRAELVAGAIQSAAQEGAQKLQAAQLQSAKNLQAAEEDLQAQLAARSGLTVEGYQSRLQKLTREMQDGAAESLSQRLQGIAAELAGAAAENVRRRLQEETSAAVEVSRVESQKRLSATAEEFFAGASKQLQERLRVEAEAQLNVALASAPNLFRERLNKLSNEAGQMLVKLTGSEIQKLGRDLLQSSSETLQKDMGHLAVNLQINLKAFLANLADQARKKLLEMSQSTLEELNKEAGTGLEVFRTRLHEAAQESHEESLRELETNFQEALEKQRAAIAVLLQQQAEQSRQLGLQIKTMSNQIVAKAAELLNRQIGKYPPHTRFPPLRRIASVIILRQSRRHYGGWPLKGASGLWPLTRQKPLERIGLQKSRTSDI